MAYFPSRQSDSRSFEVLASTEMSGAGVATDAIDVTGYRFVDFTVVVTDRASITQISLRPQGTEMDEPSTAYPSTDWYTNQDLVSAGSGVYNSHDWSAIAAIADSGKFTFTTPAQGIKMRAVVFATQGSATGSAFKVYASRRV